MYIYSIYLSIYPSTFNSHIYSFIPPIHPFIHQSFHPPNYLSLNLSIHRPSPLNNDRIGRGLRTAFKTIAFCPHDSAIHLFFHSYIALFYFFYSNFFFIYCLFFRCTSISPIKLVCFIL